MIDIIETLDNEGINLQETILNLENQGYGKIWEVCIECLYEKAMRDYTMSLAMQQLRKEGLL